MSPSIEEDYADESVCLFLLSAELSRMTSDLNKFYCMQGGGSVNKG
jgi:hypothetical protein